MTCPHFATLKNRINLLEEKFLKEQLQEEFSNQADFEADIEKLAAFRLLVHAEIEGYMENKAKDGLSLFRSKISSGNLDLKTIASIYAISIAIAIAGNDKVSLPISWNYNSDDFKEKVEDVLKQCDRLIVNNNGIKGSSYFMLSLMAGKLPEDIDQGLGATLTSYGRSRGDVAHKSVVHVRTFSAPSAELSVAKQLLAGLEAYFGADALVS